MGVIYDSIDEQTEKLFENDEQYVTDPFKLIDHLGVELQFSDLGSSVMGYNVFNARVPCIVLNTRMDELESQAVAYHELGHNRLHHGINTSFYRRVASKGMVDSIENEANVFMFQMLFKHRDFVQDSNKFELLDAYNLPGWMEYYFTKLNMEIV